MLETPFWQRAAASLPAHVRSRYAVELERAERIDLALDSVASACGRARAGIARWLDPSFSLKPRSHT